MVSHPALCKPQDLGVYPPLQAESGTVWRGRMRPKTGAAGSKSPSIGQDISSLETGERNRSVTSFISRQMNAAGLARPGMAGNMTVFGNPGNKIQNAPGHNLH
jgi:hypothetical protein